MIRNRVRRPFPLLLPLLTILVAIPAAGASDERKTHPDGSLQSKVLLNAKGERDGAYIEYFPGGKKVHVRAKYRKGVLDGVYETFDEKGNRVSEQQWINGRLVFPKSPRMIDAARARITKESAAAVATFGKPTNPNAPSADTLAKALGRLNSYRFLCDVPSDVTLDQEQVNVCQFGSELLVKIGKLTHDPKQPSGYPDDAFKLGHSGCARSNLFQGGGGDPAASVGAYMDDSDSSNIDRLGHRRWCLNPKMATTGFGQSGDFSAMYSFDGSRQEVPDYEFVCFPPRGACPVNMFSAKFAWHVSMNPKKYKVDDDAKLEIYAVDMQLKRRGSPLALDYSHLDRGGFGINNAIIARPKDFALSTSQLFEVVVNGVKDREGNAAEVSYFVSFY